MCHLQPAWQLMTHLSTVSLYRSVPDDHLSDMLCTGIGALQLLAARYLLMIRPRRSCILLFKKLGAISCAGMPSFQH